VANPDFMRPFVLDPEPVEPERIGAVDLYLPASPDPAPAIVFVHGGPIPAEQRPTPRDWPVYRGYGSLTAARGAVGVTVDHRLYSPVAYPEVAADVRAAVQTARDHPRVDADRVAIWVFSGGGLIWGDWLADPAPWLRCLAATYPRLAPRAEVTLDERFQPIEAVREAGDRPLVLTRVGLENPELAQTVEEFVAAAQAVNAPLRIIDVPNGHHGFDLLDHTDESRAAVNEAMDLVLSAL
jgi:acetyl esterase/lipase